MSSTQLNLIESLQNLAKEITIHNYYAEKNAPKIDVNLKGVILRKKFHELLIFMGIYFTFALTFALLISKYIYIGLNKVLHINDNLFPIIYLIVLVGFIPVIIYLMEYLKKKNQIKILEDGIQIEKGKYGKHLYSNIFNWRIDDKKRNRVILNIKNPYRNIVYDRKIDFSNEAEAIVFCEILKNKILNEEEKN